MDNELSITIDQQTVYKVSHLGEWAHITVTANHADGVSESNSVKVSIHSSYGSFGHYWNSIGPGHWTSFLLSLDIDYAMGKLCDWSTYEFDAEKSAEQVMKSLADDLEIGYLTQMEYDDICEDLEHLDGANSQDDFYNQLAHIKYFQDSYYEFGVSTRKASIDGFWERVWRPWIEMVTNTEHLRNAV